MILSTVLLVGGLSSCEAFTTAPQLTRVTSTQNMLPVSSVSDFSSIASADSFSMPSSSFELSAATLDPTTILSDVLGVFIGTPIILLVPILAALGVAGVLAYGIVAYANPEVEDDEI
ncbi:unnamed protein product [Pseudo-nitzschia multistriata]|uniref:Uncharacterized protein n=1 Tax=Pseudo-nitzschia multistriata TaxID=183589 RepID=A0A448Z657_9STRA|nr:unnamed protein product [Pseudo-nitzschia multistriata]